MSEKTGEGKAKIKEEVLHSTFATCIFAAKKDALDGRTNGIPRQSLSPHTAATLESVVAAIDDTGVRMHGLTYTPGMFGDSLLDVVLAPVRRFFEEYPHGHVYVMRFDIGIFVPPPKSAAQFDHTKSIVAQMERRNVPPINWSPGEPVPRMICRAEPLPNWLAVRADRTLFRHACNQLIEMILETYKPPPGCCLIIDYNAPAISSAAGLDAWMRGDRVQCDDYARSKIEAARRRFADIEHWHANADRLVRKLAHAGHIRVVPLCVETSLSDTPVTYQPFALPNAAHSCGEADVGCLFWLDALQADRLHHTLTGTRQTGGQVPPELEYMYSDAFIAKQGKIETANPIPLSVAEMRAAGQRLLEEDPDAIMMVSQPGTLSRRLTYTLELDGGVRPRCGAALLISVDSDFFALATLWYAQFCAEHAAEPLYCAAHAPFLSLGDIKTKRVGWLLGADDVVSTTQLKKQPDPTVQRCFEIWDIGRVCAHIDSLLPVNLGSQLERQLSFSLFCSLCRNDYLPGLPFVNRAYTLKALLSSTESLVSIDRNNVAIVSLPAMIELFKSAYYYSVEAKGKKHLPTTARAQLTYAQVSNAVARKWCNQPNAHMPTCAALTLMYRKAQWWLAMAMNAWRGIDNVLDHTIWGWPELK